MLMYLTLPIREVAKKNIVAIIDTQKSDTYSSKSNN